LKPWFATLTDPCNAVAKRRCSCEAAACKEKE